MPALESALRQAGYDDALLHRLFSQNWLDMLSRQIG
jgi:microsomal dipeptidase-like Zn-dependent dipeptidase